MNRYKAEYEIKINSEGDIWNNKGLVYYQMGKKETDNQNKKDNFTKAIICFDDAIKSEPNNAHAFNNKGITLLQLGWNEEATKCIDKAIEIDSKNPDAWNNRGRILAKLAKYQEAINYYEKALEIDPNNLNALNNKGISLAHLANLCDDKKIFSDACECYEKAINIDKKFVYAINNKAMLYASKDKYRIANEIIEESLKIDDKNAVESANAYAQQHDQQQQDQTPSFIVQNTTKSMRDPLQGNESSLTQLEIKLIGISVGID